MGVVLILLTAQTAPGAGTVRVCGTAPAGHAQCDLRIVVTRPASTVAAVSAPAVGDPDYLRQAYDLTALSASKGHGDTVAIVDAFNDPTAARDLAIYRAHYGLSACSSANGCLKIVNQGGHSAPLPPVNSAWSIEISSDLDAVSAICPNCNIDLVEARSDSSADLRTAMKQAAQLGANQISDSWSIVSPTSPFGSSISEIFGSGHAPAVIAATGDAGEVASGENAYPAALPDVTAVGGTTLEPNNSARGVTETAWSSAGYGCDTAESALDYQAAKNCQGRSYADISADADPSTGLKIYDSAEGGWIMGGGTSLATPIVAAYEALTGIDGTSSRWAYAKSSKLNAISGGYGGQTGIGTISGDIVTGAPGISDVTSTATSTSVTLTVGIYSNGETARYDWQYGTVGGYRSHAKSGAVKTASGAAQVRTVITGLRPATTYHFRLKAVNAFGTVYGYDYSFTTAASTVATSVGIGH